MKCAFDLVSGAGLLGNVVLFDGVGGLRAEYDAHICCVWSAQSNC